ncbi:MAG: hypothetical protein ACI8P0_002721 [Planctomycetaceae bacterium]
MVEFIRELRIIDDFFDATVWTLTDFQAAHLESSFTGNGMAEERTTKAPDHKL